MFLKHKQSFWSSEEKWNALSHGIGVVCKSSDKSGLIKA